MLNLLLISDFNGESLAQSVRDNAYEPTCAVAVSPFGQGLGALLRTSDVAKDFAVVWTTPHNVIPSFAQALRFETFSEEHLLSEVSDFAGYIKTSAGKFRTMFVVSWTSPCYQLGYGIANLGGGGLRTLMMKMNLKLVEELQGAPGVYLLDAQRWMETVGGASYSPKLWYLTKTPFHPAVFKEAARDIKAAMSGVMGNSTKLIILDLDNTLWGGTVGDLGWQNLRLGGHDYIGEAFLDFQKNLKALSRRGILLAIVSKNEEAIALEALSKHPEMILRPHDFVGWKINWEDKAANIAELAAELNLGLQSIVFVDDNPVERARVCEALPEVYVPSWPRDATLFPSYLLQLRCFDSPFITAEDLLRTESYVNDKYREQIRKAIPSHEEWLESLGTEVMVETVGEANLVRITQLLNKTNQMNLSTRRVTERELSDWLQSEHRKLWAVRVKDRFGDMGLTGVVTLEITGDNANVCDFVLSCRVFGRNIEQLMVAVAVEYCRKIGLEKLVATYIPTSKNKPCFEFWNASGFRWNEGDNTFTWTLDKNYPYPEGIHVTGLAKDLKENVRASALARVM
jgi:FkbH-like protein